MVRLEKGNKSKVLFIFIMFAAVLIFTGCSGGDPAPDQQDASTLLEPLGQEPVTEPEKPVELVFYALSVLTGTDEEKAAQYTSFVQKVHPHISFQFINAEGDQTIDKYLLTNEPMDILFGSFANFVAHKDKNILGDMTDLIKKHGFDLGTIEQPYIDLVHEFDDGITYRGLATGSAGGGIPVNQYSLAVYDSTTGKASINTAEWKRYFETITPFFKVPNLRAYT